MSLLALATPTHAHGQSGALTHRAAVFATDTLVALLHDRFTKSPISLDLRGSQRASVSFVHAPWEGASDQVQFDRAYDVARFVWDHLGVVGRVDTVSIRTTSHGSPDTSRTQVFSFYPKQLTARARPRLGHAP